MGAGKPTGLKPKAKAKGPSRTLRKSTMEIRVRREDLEKKAVAFAKISCSMFLKGFDKDKRNTPTLQQHVKDLYAHRKNYEQRLAIEHKPAHKGKITEADGELATTRYMLNNFPNAELFSGFSPGIGIDQIWIERDPFSNQIVKAYIVEAKGEGAKLATETETKGPQMSCEWVAKSVDALPHDPEVKSALLAALAGKKGAPAVQGLVIGLNKGIAMEMPTPGPPDYPKGGIYNGTGGKYLK